MAKKMKMKAPTRGFNRGRAARVLVEATLTDDAKAARAHGVTAASIRSWRERLESDPELAAMYAEQLAHVDGAWRHELRLVVLECARKLRELVGKAASIEDMRDVLDALRTCGELLVQYEALVFDGFDAANRGGDSAAPDAPGARQGPPAIH